MHILMNIHFTFHNIHKYINYLIIYLWIIYFIFMPHLMSYIISKTNVSSRVEHRANANSVENVNEEHNLTVARLNKVARHH